MLKACIRILGCFILLSSMGQALFAQDVKGSITYVSKENAFIDLGRKIGVQAGDTVLVFTEGEGMSLAIVMNTSSSSSSLLALNPDGMNWKIGDSVQTTIQRNIARPLLSEMSDSSASAPPPAQVFLDSAIFKPRLSASRSLKQRSRFPDVSGYLSARLDQRGGSDSIPDTRNLALYSQLRAKGLLLEHLDASMYLRGSESSSSGGTATHIYSMMLEYANPSSAFKFYLGRMYHPQLSMLGTVDGLGLSWNGASRVISLLGGAAPSLSGTAGLDSRQKFGVVDEEKFGWGSVQIGSVSELSGSSLSRSYLLLGAIIRPLKSLRVRTYTEMDMDPGDASPNQAVLSITRFRASMNIRLLRSLNTNLRYSYRENVVDLLDTAKTEFELAARHALHSSLSWIATQGLSFSGQASLRTDGSGKDIQVFGLTVNHRGFGPHAIHWNAGSMLMLSYLTEGARLYASTGFAWFPSLEIDLYDEIYAYRILGDNKTRVRHQPELSFSAQVPGLNRLRLRTRFEQEAGETFYRISLSASKQF